VWLKCGKRVQRKVYGSRRKNGKLYYTKFTGKIVVGEKG
jgi:hypothetical protein